MSYHIEKMQPFGVSIRPERANESVLSVSTTSLRELVDEFQLVLLRGYKTDFDADGFANYCSLWGEISIWPFGKVLELVEAKAPKDHIFDHSYVPLHWDGMYRPQVPELQVFHCVKAPSHQDGGSTTFSNTKRLLEMARPEVVEAWQEITGSYQRKMEFYHSRAVAPLITQHPTRGFSVVRYCEPPLEGDETFINKPEVSFQGIKDGDVAGFHKYLRNALYGKGVFYAHSWEDGDIVISDNYTLLHGREAFTTGAPRHLRRVHILGQPALENPHLVFHK